MAVYLRNPGYVSRAVFHRSRPAHRTSLSPTTFPNGHKVDWRRPARTGPIPRATGLSLAHRTASIRRALGQVHHSSKSMLATAREHPKLLRAAIAYISIRLSPYGLLSSKKKTKLMSVTKKNEEHLAGQTSSNYSEERINDVSASPPPDRQSEITPWPQRGPSELPTGPHPARACTPVQSESSPARPGRRGCRRHRR